MRLNTAPYRMQNGRFGADVPREPISLTAAFAALTAAASTPVIVGGALTWGSVAFSAALMVGTTLISQALAPDAPSFGEDTPVNSPESRYTTRQSSPPKRDIYGTAHVGGAIFFEEIKPPYLYRGYAIAAHEIDGIEAIYVGTERLSFLALPANVILTPQAVDDQAAYDQNLQVSIRLGTADQTIDPLLSAEFRHLDESFRQQGVATVVVRCDFGDDEDEHRELWGSGDPKFFFLVRGRHVYDPRKIGQVVDDETTWEFENNATLCQADYIRQPHGGRINQARIDWERIAESADYDDDLCGCKDGTLIRRYTVDGMSARDQSPADVISSMLTANGGTLVQDGGMIWIDSSQPRDPCVTIYDDLMVGGIAYRNDKPKRDLVNTTQSRFVADEREFTTSDGPVLEDEDLIEEDGEPLTATLTLPWTRDYRRVERLQKRSQDMARLGRTLDLPVDVRILAEARDRLINAVAVSESTLFPQTDGYWRISTVAFGENFSSLNLNLMEYDKAIETDFIPADDERDFAVTDVDVR